ncbi:MAG: hypothetical protein RL380_175 [Verrucomicrobiota bacterium]|jgi:PAS domain S-box-containing protein
MLRLRDISLTRKLVYLILLVAGTVLLLASAAFVTRDWLTARNQLEQELNNRAALVAKNLSAAVTFNDRATADEIIRFLGADRHLTHAATFLRDGQILAAYRRADLARDPGPIPLRSTGVQFEDRGVWISTVIRAANGEHVGQLVLHSDLLALHERLKEDLIITASVLLFSILIAILLSAALQPLISRPILQLARTADEVATRRDYAIRATKTSRDEIGHLVDRFNEMLTQIATRDDALHAAQVQLEARVAERTAELTHSNATLQSEIFERQRVEKILRESEARFTLAFKANPLAMCIATLDEGRILNTNDALLRTLVRPREHFLDRTLVETGLCADPQQFHEYSRELLAHQPIRDRECLFHTADGQPRRALLSLTRIQLDQTPAALVILNDITERLNLEAQLRQSQKMEGIGQLAAGVAHDYNNILTIIQGHIELVMQTHRHDALLTESLTHVATAANRATNLTRQLLAFSRRQVMQPKPIELNEIVTNLVKMLARILGEHITLELHLWPSLPNIHADIGMMEQVITNLAVNARDAMPNGGKLSLTTELVTLDPSAPRQHPQARPGKFVLLRITDTGTGMDEATLARAFEPFFTTKPVGKGTGLGLATAYGIVQQHRGWIEVRSTVGQGTEFRLYLPESPLAKTTGNTDRIIAPLKGGSETILLVEDETSVRQLARAILANSGYTILEAGDGPEALKIWEQHHGKIDLVLTDLVMPNGLTGRELARKLKAVRPTLKIIYTSGYSVDVAGRDLAEEPDFHFLPKPYHPPSLLRAVRARLEAD